MAAIQIYERQIEGVKETEQIYKCAIKNPARKERRSIHKIVAGKAITEPETSKKLKHYIE
jgi:hypothetical protein